MLSGLKINGGETDLKESDLIGEACIRKNITLKKKEGKKSGKRKKKLGMRSYISKRRRAHKIRM